jgi:hypothetical protein
VLQHNFIISNDNPPLANLPVYAIDDPAHISRMNILKDTMILMYSQNPVAFEELTQTVSLHETEFSEIMKDFHDGIINAVNGDYVLK